MEPNFAPTAFRNYGFPSTHWSVIYSCARNDADAQAAREVLCRDYWYPVYAYIKRSGYQGNDAEDITQDFFAYILTRPWLDRVDQAKGKFRSFLLISLTNFLRDYLDHQRASKRAGTYQHVPLDMGSADARYPHTAMADVNQNTMYEVEWANAVVAATLARLENAYIRSGKSALYGQLKPFLSSEGDAARYSVISEDLGTSASNIRVGVHRLRKEYGKLLREEVARTVAGPEDLEGGMRYLRAVLAGI